MRLTGFRRRWRLWAALVLLILIGMIWLVIIRTPPEPAGRLLMERQQNNKELFYLYDFSGKQVSIVPYNEATHIDVAYHMSLSADGKRAAFIGADRNSYRIYIADNALADVRPLTSGPGDFNPVFSPDGNTVVFERLSGYLSALFAVDVTTGIECQLTDFENDIEADWSPDGKRIVFTTSRDGFQELYTMAPDGTDLKRLTNNVNLNDLRAKYSPDGKWIAYMTNHAVDDGSGEIWLMDADGQNQRRLTDNQQDDGEPMWSPDSRQIVFTRVHLDRKGMDIFTYDLTRAQVHQSTDTAGYAFQPAWSPDSAWIAFTSNPTGDGQQMNVDIMRADGTDRHALLVGVDYIPPGRGFKWIR